MEAPQDSKNEVKKFDHLQALFHNDISHQKESSLIRITRKMMKDALRIELLAFFKFKELVKISLLSKEMYTFVDPNRDKIESIQEIEELMVQESSRENQQHKELREMIMMQIQTLEAHQNHYLSQIISIQVQGKKLQDVDDGTIFGSNQFIFLMMNLKDFMICQVCKIFKSPYPVKVREENTEFIPTDQTLKTLKLHGYLNFLALKQDYLFEYQQHEKTITYKYKKCKLQNGDGVFIGEYRKEGDNEFYPEGFVRFISYYGYIYEGCVMDNKFEGWGRLVFSNTCTIGYWKNNKSHGYSRRFYNKKLIKEGWINGLPQKYEKDSRKYKYWDNKDKYYIKY